MSKIVTIRLLDGSITQVPYNVIIQSITISGMLDPDQNTDEDPYDITLPEISKEILDKVIIFCEYQSDTTNDLITNENIDDLITKPLKSKVFTENYENKWYVNYVSFRDDKVPMSDDKYIFLFKLLNASNYFNISVLLKIISTYIACLMKGEEQEDIRKIFGICQKSA